MIQHLEREAMPSSQQSELPVLDFQTIEFYVGNAKQAALYYNKLFGFDIVAYRGPETGHRDSCSYVLRQNNIQFVMTGALQPDHPVAQHVHQHGDGVKDIGFAVSDLNQTIELASRRGAVVTHSAASLADEGGVVHKATIATYGDTTHTFFECEGYHGVCEPGFEPRHLPANPVGLQRVDHIVGNVEKGRMEHWVRFYENVFGFRVFRSFDQSDISTQYSSLVSKVMSNASGTIKLPINEPAEGVWKSQIQEYLDFYGSPGVQHIAISTHNIIETVDALRANGVDFMTVPQTYYDSIAERVGEIREPLQALADLGILIDRDEEGYLLQIFTQPVQDRPTFFFEIIQRAGSEGFGKGNFKALFEAIERDQARRGNV